MANLGQKSIVSTRRMTPAKANWHVHSPMTVSALVSASEKNPEIIETCQVTYQMKQWDDVHHLN